MVLYGLSARTTNMPGLEYIAVRIFKWVGGRPMPLKASYEGSPATSAISSSPFSNSGMFSLLPLVLRGRIESAGSAAFMASANASP